MTLCKLLLLVSLALVAVVGCTPRQQAATPAPPGAVTAPSRTGDQDLASQTTSAPPAESPGKALSGTLRVGVPCGLAMAYKAVRDKFKAAHPEVKFVDHVKNIGPMTKEIRDGKVTLDLFLSLGEREIQTLMDAGVIAGKPTPFLRQAMQLAVQLGNPLGIKTLEDLGGPKVKTVAVCLPELTIGQAGEAALKKAGVWDKLVAAGKIVRPDQPAKAKSMVIEKRADATFIYAACANPNWKEGDPERSVAGKADVVMTVPESMYGGMYAVAAILTNAPNPQLAQEFVKFLLTKEAQDAVAEWGYGRVDQQAAAGDDELKIPASCETE